MVVQYTKECSIVFIMNLISAPFQLSHPFPSPHIELFVLQRVECDVTIVTACTDKI